MNVPLPVWIAGVLTEIMVPPILPVAIFIFAAIFLLLRRDDVPSCIARLANSPETGSTVGALADTTRDLRRHLFLQAALNLCFGGIVAIGLHAIGVANFGLWAFFAILLRTIPFVGVPAAAACPLMLVISSDPTGWLVCATAMIFLSADLAVRLVHKKAVRSDVPGPRPLAAFSSVLAWTAVWGIAGLLLAAPLTLALVIFGRNFPSLQFLNLLLVQPRDPKRHTAAPAKVEPTDTDGQDATVKALLHAQRERGGVALDTMRGEKLLAKIVQAVSHSSDDSRALTQPLALRPWNLSPEWGCDHILCLAGPGVMDNASASMLSLALKRKGLPSRVAPFDEETLNSPSEAGLLSPRHMHFLPRSRGLATLAHPGPAHSPEHRIFAFDRRCVGL